MISTKDLVEFMKDRDWNLWEEGVKTEEYKREIVARLERYDEMKEGIEKMIRDCRDSSVIDTEIIAKRLVKKYSKETLDRFRHTRKIK